MVVEQIDIEGIAIFEAENDAPVGGYLNRPEAFQLALERVEPEAWGVHVSHSRRDVQAAQDAADLGHVLRPDTAAIALLEEALQPPMPEAPDRHAEV
jgi:hypothetical protein